MQYILIRCTALQLVTDQEAMVICLWGKGQMCVGNGQNPAPMADCCRQLSH